MIISKIHPGSGLGNQLHSYLVARILKVDKGYDFSIAGYEYFKGKSFMELDIGKSMPFQTRVEYLTGKLIVESNWRLFEEKTDYYNPEFNFIENNTVIDGYWQDERYWDDYEDEVREWLKVEPLDMPGDLCVINFRGGEYTMFPDLFLTQAYWDLAISTMQVKYPLIRFEVHTDDPMTAKHFFPDYKIIQDIGLNWRSIRYAKHLILSNSSFAILPAWLNQDVKEVLAPRYWARRNKGIWALPQNYYKRFTYL